jgi:hypothetical protein
MGVKQQTVYLYMTGFIIIMIMVVATSSSSSSNRTKSGTFALLPSDHKVCSAALEPLPNRRKEMDGNKAQ